MPCRTDDALAQQQQKRLDPGTGYDPHLERRISQVIGPCHANGVKIISDMGAANPQSATEAIARIARNAGISGLKIAYVSGDDVLQSLREVGFPVPRKRNGRARRRMRVIMYSFDNSSLFRARILGRRHMAAAGHDLSAMAAHEILLAGDNAIGIALAVVESVDVGFADVAPTLIRVGGTRTSCLAEVDFCRYPAGEIQRPSARRYLAERGSLGSDQGAPTVRHDEFRRCRCILCGLCTRRFSDASDDGRYSKVVEADL